MRTIAGVSQKGRKDVVLSMLRKQQHRTKIQWILTENDVCTMGMDSEPTDGNDFSTRAYISDGKLFLRSQTHLYCIGQKE